MNWLTADIGLTVGCEKESVLTIGRDQIMDTSVLKISDSFDGEEINLEMSYVKKWDKEASLELQVDLVGSDNLRGQQAQDSLDERAEQSPGWEYDGDAYGAYLKKIASIPLLTREQEVEIAKGIEWNQGKIAQIVLRYPHILQEVGYRQEQQPLKRFSERMARMAASHKQLEVLRGLGQWDPELAKKEDEILRQRHEIFCMLKLSDRQIGNFISRLKSYVEGARLAANAVETYVKETGLAVEDLQKLVSSVMNDARLPEKIVKENGISASRLLKVEEATGCILPEICHLEYQPRRKAEELEKDLKEVLEAHAEARRGKKDLVQKNLRLVISVAKKYTNRGIQLVDLVQEGNIGLMRAVDKFDYRRGHKFSTYACWWIRQGIIRAIQEHALTVRVPVHMHDTINRLKLVSRELTRDMGRRPTVEEIAEKMELPAEKVKRVFAVARRRYSVSLDTPVGDGNSELGDFVADKDTASPEEVFLRKRLAEQTRRSLATLNSREERILRRRFGIGEARSHTLRELGEEFGVTRERIRQLEAKALKKLQTSRRKEHFDLSEE